MQEIVCAGLVNKDDEYIIVQEAKDDAYDTWGLPAGRLEDGESLEDCVSREITEETGLDLDPMGLVGVYFHITEQRLVPIIVFEMGFDEADHGSTELNPIRYDVKSAEWDNQRGIMRRELRSEYVLRAIQDYNKQGSVSLSYVEKLNSLEPSTLTRVKMQLKALNSGNWLFKKIGMMTVTVIILGLLKLFQLVYKKKQS